MRILFYSYVFWPESFLINELAEELQGRGHQVSVLTSLPNYSSGQISSNYSLLKGPYFEQFKGVKIFRYPVFPRKKGFFHLSLNYSSNVFSAVLRVLSLSKTDVSFIFATSPIFIAVSAIVLKHVRKTPVVMWYQDLWPESFLAVAKVRENSVAGKILEKLVRWIYKHVDVMLIQSPAFKHNLEKLNYSGQIRHIPNWAPEVSVQGSTPSWIEDLPKDRFLICFAGNLGKAQSLHSVLDAVNNITDKRVLFVFVGDGREAESLKGRAKKECSDQVIFTGRKPLEDMPHLFAKCDLLLVSLAKDPLFSLTIPSKMQAYMASGKPILGFMDGVGAEIIRQADCGFTSPAEESASLAMAINKAVSLSPSELKYMGQRARDFYLKNYERNRVISSIETVLKETVK